MRKWELSGLESREEAAEPEQMGAPGCKVKRRLEMV